MLEHSAMFLNVPPQYEDDTSFFPDFYTRLGPCELQDPVWAKMSSLTTGANKKRKKSETKPQAQINKCNNEKRRREQENIYIEELAELISANFADMSSLSVKPDKCAILQETVNQIRNIKQREAASQACDPVQQGEVSSSRPTILSNEVYGPLLLEALEGFLFVVNAEGKVEHVTENVSNYIKYTKDDILAHSIFSFIHPSDHARFRANLLPMTISWGNDSSTPRSRSFSVRFIVKPPDEHNSGVEEEKQPPSRSTSNNPYELMHISSTPLRDQSSVNDNDNDNSGPYLLCVASRISHRDAPVGANIEQFTTKLDTSGKIIGVDVSSLSPHYNAFINRELVERPLRDLVPQQDLHKLNAHLRDTIHVGQSTSSVYKLQVWPEKCVHVQTKSKLFKVNPHVCNEVDFIMATHTIVSEFDTIGPSDTIGSVGGPLMTSIVNGTTVPTTSRNGSDNSTASLIAANTSSPATAFGSFSTSLDNDFSFELFQSSSLGLDPGGWPEAAPPPRPDSRHTATPVSTSSSNAAASPLAAFVTTQQSPVAAPPPSATPASVYGTSFPFSPLGEQQASYGIEEVKDTKVNVLDEASTMIAESGRLRDLLTKPPTVADSSGSTDGFNRHTILQGLLNQQDEDDRSDNRTSPRGMGLRGPMAGPSDVPKTSSAENQMLIQLLNDRSDDDDNLEARAGVRKKSELLHQLLKNENRDNENEKKNDVQTNEDDSLLRSLGFTSSPSPPNREIVRSRKRPSDERQDMVTGNKRQTDGSQVTSTAQNNTGSKLCERNKMLAMLLAKESPNQQPIPHLPTSLISATPQEGLPRVSTLPDVKTSKPMPTRSTATSISQQRTVVKNTIMAVAGNRPNTNYLNSMLTHSNNLHHQRTANNVGQCNLNQVDSGSYTSPATSTTDGNLELWADNNNVNANDPLLSDILDQVMDIVPDEIGRVFTQEGQQVNNFQNEMTEKMAINSIQKALMQLGESVVKSPSSPTVSLPGTPPAYSPSPMTTQSQQMRPFAPPPNYPQSGFKQQRISVRSGTPQYVTTSGTLTTNQQQLLLQRKQHEDRRRLLQQQQQQELLIPSNATAAELNSGLQNIDSLLNNTVAPNVSLQRSASLNETQSGSGLLALNYGTQLSQQQQSQRLNSQQSYSPHSQLVSPSGFSQTSAGNYQQQTAARLSPQFTLRTAYPQASGQNQNWQQSQVRLSTQNPMLNAQLTGAFVSGGHNGRNFQRTTNQTQQSSQQQQQQQSNQSQQRSLNSPGTVTSRHSPYQQDTFPPPTSPNSAAFNQNQYLRLQRTNSVPTATTQLPGGLGSPRPYGREHLTHSYSQLPSNPHQHPMMYQQDSSQYCYDQTGLQLSYNGGERGGRPPPHLQAGVSVSAAPASEFVRQELRAVVGARTGQAQTAPNRTTPSQLLAQQQVDLEALGLTFELPTSGEYYGGRSSR